MGTCTSNKISPQPVEMNMTHGNLAYVQVDNDNVMTMASPTFLQLTCWVESDLVGYNISKIMSFNYRTVTSEIPVELRCKTASKMFIVARSETKTYTRLLVESYNKKTVIDKLKKDVEIIPKLTHDIRNHLHVAMSGFEILKSKCASDEKMKVVVESIQLSHKQIISLISSNMELHRLTSGIPFEFVAINELILEITTYTKPLFMAKHRQVMITNRVPNRLQIKTVPFAVRSILDNLISHSCKYSTKVLVEIAFNYVMSSNDKGVFHFFITDHSSTYSENVIQYLLGRIPYSQVEGSDFGIRIVKDMLFMINASISVESRKPYYTKIHIQFKCDWVVKTTPRLVTKKLSTTRFKILVVDDNIVSTKLLAMMLGKSHDVAVVHDGQQCIDFLAKNQQDWGVDIVLMDIMMPVMDGIEATTIIRKLYDIYVVCISSANPSDEMFNDIVHKPFTREKLSTVLSTYKKRIIDGGVTRR